MASHLHAELLEMYLQVTTVVERFLPRNTMLSAVHAVVMCLFLCVFMSVSVCHTLVLHQNG